MRSVADIPPGDDADDELDGISPELVLVDPDLARLVREREPTAEIEPSLRKRGPTLRLVSARGAEGDRAAVAPRPAAPSDGGSDGSPDPAPDIELDAVQAPTAPAALPAPTIEPAPTALEPSEVAEQPVAEEPVMPRRAIDVEPEPAFEPPTGEPSQEEEQDVRVVDAEPARALEPPRHDVPAPLAEPVRSPRLEPQAAVYRPAPAPPASVAPVMPHPVARPVTVPRARRAPGARRRGRRWLAFVIAVAVASVAVFGALQLVGGSPGPAGKGGGSAALGTPPSVKAAGRAKAASKPKETKPKATSKPKAAAAKQSKPTSAPKPKPAPTKASAVTTPKPKPKPKPKAVSKPTPGPAAGAGSGAASTPPPTTPAPTPASETRRFAWAPVEGATGYHVELFRGSERVLAQETKEPVLELGPTWRYEGKTVQLVPGTYRWYVWPVTQSGRATQAVVQAKLTVP